MPALAKCSPLELKEILLSSGWRVYNEDQYNWSLVKGIGSESIEIPRKGKLTSFAVRDSALEKAGLAPGDYFELLGKVRSEDEHRS